LVSKSLSVRSGPVSIFRMLRIILERISGLIGLD
jgi:hypothetical protein